MTTPRSACTGRTCTTCGETKPWEKFDKKRGGINGRHSRCKTCVSSQKRAWWRKRKMKKKNHPRVLDLSNDEILIRETPLTFQEKTDLEKALRGLVVDTIIRERKK